MQNAKRSFCHAGFFFGNGYRGPARHSLGVEVKVVNQPDDVILPEIVAVDRGEKRVEFDLAPFLFFFPGAPFVFSSLSWRRRSHAGDGASSQHMRRAWHAHKAC